LATFSNLNLSPLLLRALEEEGYSIPTPIQAQTIPSALEGRDLLGCAQTGTGKTAAFALPILHRLVSAPPDTSRRGPALPRALILSPTRELAGQIGDSFRSYGRHTGLTHTVIFGGVSQFHQVRAMHRGVDILVATPGRLMDLMEQKLVNLTAVEIFVLDEADRMLDMGFIAPIRHIAASIPNPARQTLLFSATMPKEIQRFAESLLKNPVRVAVTPVASAAPLIEQSVYPVARQSKQALLHHLVREMKIERAMVFTKTKHGADKVCRRLGRSGIPAVAIHGNKNQNQRTRALESFRSGHVRVLVATDVAARGLDIDAVSHVFNFDMPIEAEAYVHRIGRTGRAGASGMAISFCDQDERSLLRQIERITGKQVPVTRITVALDDSEGEEPSNYHTPRDRYEARPARQGPPRPAPHSYPAAPQRSSPASAPPYGSSNAASHAPSYSPPAKSSQGWSGVREVPAAGQRPERRDGPRAEAPRSAAPRSAPRVEAATFQHAPSDEFEDFDAPRPQRPAPASAPRSGGSNSQGAPSARPRPADPRSADQPRTGAAHTGSKGGAKGGSKGSAKGGPNRYASGPTQGDSRGRPQRSSESRGGESRSGHGGGGHAGHGGPRGGAAASRPGSGVGFGQSRPGQRKPNTRRGG